MQRVDFVELFRIMAGLPITIRLLDPPLHEFLPVSNQELEELQSTWVLTSTCAMRAGSLR